MSEEAQDWEDRTGPWREEAEIERLTAEALVYADKLDSTERERDQLMAELKRERASLSAACEASDRRAADLNREVIADNERLRAELRVAHRDAIKERENEREQLRELREAMDRLVAQWGFRIGRPKWQQVSEELAGELARVTP